MGSFRYLRTDDTIEPLLLIAMIILIFVDFNSGVTCTFAEPLGGRKKRCGGSIFSDVLDYCFWDKV